MPNTAIKYDDADINLEQLCNLCPETPVLLERKERVLVFSLAAMRKLNSGIYSNFCQQLDKLRNNFVIGYRD